MKESILNYPKDCFKGKNVFLRAELNVPLSLDRDSQSYVVVNDARIRDLLPTLKFLLDCDVRKIGICD